MSAASPIRIIIADDHEALRRSIKLSLLAYDEFELVGEAANGVEALELSSKVRPDVILMDVSMPEMNGVTATALIRRCCPQINIIILASFNDAPLIEATLQAGADSYLYKDFTIDLLAELIRKSSKHSSQSHKSKSRGTNKEENSYDKLSRNCNEATRG